MGRIVHSDSALRLAESLCGREHRRLAAAILALRARAFQEVWVGIPHPVGDLTRAAATGSPIEYVGPKIFVWIEPATVVALARRPNQVLVATVRSGADYMEISSVRVSSMSEEDQADESREANRRKAFKELSRRGFINRERGSR